MPIGPSHSGRSSGGHSFGGGSSSRSSGFGSSGGRSHHFHSGPRRFVFFGRTYVMAPNGLSFVAILLFFIFFAGVFCFGSWAGIKNGNDDIDYYSAQIAIMEDDAEFYSTLIANATNHVSGYYLETASFDNNDLDSSPFKKFEYYPSNPTTPGAYYSFMDKGVIWYFIVYKYSHGTGMTYTQFSNSQLPSDGKIQIAYTYFENNWWSINTNYSLEKNKDYAFAKAELQNSKEAKQSSITSTIVSVLIIVGLVVAVIFVIKKNLKREEEKNTLELQKTKAEVQEATAKADEAKRRASQVGRKCKYCGSAVPDEETKCTNCGSSVFD